MSRSIYSIVGPNLALYNKKISKNFNTNKPIDYVMSKSSIPNLTKYIAINYGRKNIRSNCVVPHGIKNLHKKDFVQKFSNLSPIGRMSDVKEVIANNLFIFKRISYMTGSTLIVDGGWTMERNKLIIVSYLKMTTLL